MADNFQETSSMCTWNRTKNLSPPLKKMRGEKKNTQMQANIFLIVVLLQFCDNSKKC